MIKLNNKKLRVVKVIKSRDISSGEYNRYHQSKECLEMLNPKEDRNTQPPDGIQRNYLTLEQDKYLGKFIVLQATVLLPADISDVVGGGVDDISVVSIKERVGGVMFKRVVAKEKPGFVLASERREEEEEDLESVGESQVYPSSASSASASKKQMSAWKSVISKAKTLTSPRTQSSSSSPSPPTYQEVAAKEFAKLPIEEQEMRRREHEGLWNQIFEKYPKMKRVKT